MRDTSCVWDKRLGEGTDPAWRDSGALQEVQVLGAGDGLVAAVRVELGVDVLQVGADRVVADEEPIGDPGSGQLRREQTEHVHLAVGQRFDELRGGRRRLQRQVELLQHGLQKGTLPRRERIYCPDPGWPGASTGGCAEAAG